ncbi:MAG: hypothetical protein ACLT98_07780 [Eggerthellaceae bacterium]
MDKMILQMQDVYLSTASPPARRVPPPPTTPRCSRAWPEGLLKMDVVSYPMHGEDVDKILSDYAEFDSHEYTNHFRFGGLKMFFDGSPRAAPPDSHAPGDE